MRLRVVNETPNKVTMEENEEEKIVNEWQAEETRIYWSNVLPVIRWHFPKKPIILPEGSNKDYIFSEKRTYCSGAGRMKFERYHVYTWYGKTNGKMKREIKKLYDEGEHINTEITLNENDNDRKDSFWLEEPPKEELAERFNHKYIRRRRKGAGEEGITMEHKETSLITDYWCSKIRKVSLEDQAAAVISRIINNKRDVDKMVKMKLIPKPLAELIKEYV